MSDDFADRLADLQGQLAHAQEMVKQIRANAQDQLTDWQGRAADVQARIDRIQKFVKWEASQ